MAKEPEKTDDDEVNVDVDDTDLDELFADDVEDDEEDAGTDDSGSDDDDSGKDDTKKSDDEDEDDDTSDSDDEETGDEDESEPPADGDDSRKMVPIAALHDERRKARAYKEELDKLKSGSTGEFNEPEPDRYEQPEEHDAWLIRREEAKREAARDARWKETVDESRANALEKYDDYEAMEESFLVLAARDKQLYQDMIDSSDPAEFAYLKAKEWESQREIKLLEKLKAEGKLKEESDDSKDDTKAKTPIKKKKRPSLANASGSSGGSSAAEVDNSDDLDAMFANSDY